MTNPVSTGSHGTLSFNIWQGPQDVASNTSVDSWQLVLSSNYSGTFQASAKAWNVYVNGSSYSGTFTFNFRNYSSVIIASGTTTVAHNADGTKTINYSATIAATGTASMGGPTTVDGSYTQTTIARASNSTLSTSSLDAGTPITINTNRASSGFTHTISYAFGGSSGTIASAVGASTTWVPPLSLLSQIPNAVSGPGSITTATYSGGTYIGTKTVNFTLNAPSSIVPSFPTVTNSEATPGVAALVGGYVQGVSKLNLAITDASGTYGSSIVAYRIAVGVQVLTTASGMTPAAISVAGTVPIVGTITDSRGRTASKTVNITVLPYLPPTVDTSTFKLSRALSSGVLNSDGTYIRIDMNAAVQSLVVGTQKNTISYQVYTRLRGASAWTLKASATPAGLGFGPPNYVLISSFAIEDSWEVQVQIIDKLGTSVIQGTVATSAIFMHWGDRTKGLGIGKFWERGAVDILGQAYQNDGKAILDTVSGFTRAEGVSALGAARNRNRVINGNFRTNQRGYRSGYSLPASNYGAFDRWKSAASTTLSFTAAPQGQQVTINSGGDIYQIIEQENMEAGTYVLSWTGTALGQVYLQGSSKPGFSSSPRTVYLNGSDNVVVEFSATGGSKSLGEVQLESGSAPTSFERISVGDELMQCLRYYWRQFATTSAINQPFGVTYGIGGTSTRMVLALPVQMRAKPSAVDYHPTLSKLAARIPGSSTFTITSISLDPAGTSANAIQVNMGNSSGTTNGSPYIFQANNASDAYFGVSAEL